MTLWLLTPAGQITIAGAIVAMGAICFASFVTDVVEAARYWRGRTQTPGRKPWSAR